MTHKKVNRSRFLTLVLWVILLTGCANLLDPATPTPLSTRVEPSPTLTETLTATPTLTSTVTPTLTFTPTSTFTPTLTLTPTPLPAVRIPIIEYHDPDFRLNDQVQMTIPWFEEQIRWLADNGYRTLDGNELVTYLDGTATFPQRSVVLSFDIGTAKRPIYTDTVIPLLKKYKFKAIFFILANDTVVVDACDKPKHFCWGDFKQWADDGVITIASHGLYHPDFSKLTVPEMKYELETPRKLLVEKTGRMPVAFAYPLDVFTDQAATLAKAAGYQFAVAGNTRKDLSAAPRDPDRYKLPRVYPYSNTFIYPNLTGFNHPFAEVISDFSRPGMVANVTATPAGTTDDTSASAVLKYCKTVPTDPTLRINSMLQFSFQSDVSPAARAKLTGLSTSVSCNVFPNNKPEAVVVHYTVGDLTSSLYSFRQASGTSSHYLIDRDGTVVQMVPETLTAMHASCTNTRLNCVASCPICDDSNGKLTEPYTRSIGIELVNRGHVASPDLVSPLYEDYLRSFSYPYWEDYTQAQIDALRVLVGDISARWKIPIDDRHILGHYRINQKVDPGPALNLFWTRGGNPPREPIFAPAATARP